MRRSSKNASMWQPFGLAIGLHVMLAALVVLSTLSWKPFKAHTPMALTIEAVIVDTTQMATRRDAAQKAAEVAQKQQQLEENRAEELEKQKQREREQDVKKQQQAELEKQKLLEADKQKQIEADKQKQVEAEKQKQLQAEKQKQVDAEKQKQLEAEALRLKQQEDEARKKKESQEKIEQLRKEQERKQEEQRLQQQKELEQVRKQQEEAEKQRKLEAEKLKQLEARETAQAQAKADELAAKAQVDREAQSEKDGLRADLGGKYRLLVQQIVTDNWLRPPTAKPGLKCVLKIVQIPGGEVISAAISGSCNGDEATRRSIVAAVERIDALPYRGYEDVFAREIDFEFKYDGE
ncbi:MAG: cell envelope integrity protein TolA [Xanthomonadales bacterium]|nr:cell envelope integrity protein TolA [Xanthomonadales bacterium]